MTFLKTLRQFSFLSVLFLFTALISCNNNEQKLKDYVKEQDPLEIPALLPRKGELATAAEWPKTQTKVAELIQKLVDKPEDVKTRLQLATIYIAEQRITGEHHYYYPAIEKILDGILSIDANNFEARVYKASVKMSLHQFAEAKKLAEEAKNINPNNAYVYGILVDANVELGNYTDAVAASDKMQTIKPSLESYARASYLREIYGDYPGSIEAMKLAVQAGLPGSEPQCWSRNILGDLYFTTNNITEAERSYRENLSLRPSYAPSMAGLAKVEAYRKNYQAALAMIDSANAVMPGAAYDEQKAEVYTAMGDTAKATAMYRNVEKTLQLDVASGHSVSLEQAKIFTKLNSLDSAEKHGMEEFAVRPNNIDVNKQLAWIAYNKKDYAKAKSYLKTAMQTGSKNPELLTWAALIEKQ